MMLTKQSFFTKHIKDNLIFLILIVNLIFSSFIIEEVRSNIVLANYLTVGALILIHAINHNIYYTNITFLIAFILLYFILLLPLSSNLFVSINYYIKFFLGIIMFVISYKFFTSKIVLLKLINISAFLVLYGIGYFFISNFQGFGGTMYKYQILLVGESHNLIWQAYSVIVLVSLLVIFFNVSHRYKAFVLSLCGLMIIIFILIFKRAPILIIITGLSFYIIISGHKYKYRMIALCYTVAGLLFVTYPFYSDFLKQNIVHRSDKISGLESLQSEGRYKENIAVLKYLSRDPFLFLFGSGELFNSRFRYDIYTRFLKKDRQIHNNYANLLWSSGIVGLFIYLAILILIMKRFYFLKKLFRKDSFENLIASTGLVLCLIFFFSGFAGGLLFIPYQSYLFTCLGAFLGYLSFQISALPAEADRFKRSPLKSK